MTECRHQERTTIQIGEARFRPGWWCRSRWQECEYGPYLIESCEIVKQDRADGVYDEDGKDETHDEV